MKQTLRSFFAEVATCFSTELCGGTHVSRTGGRKLRAKSVWRQYLLQAQPT
ncbi:hypothetical protein, partial [Neisseria sp. P0014.S006]|uniref:hypothetical protein n=1 Tax=Neisseria sp. P0014.S006 TaxID=3436752 RepID=UPI003F7E2F57